MVLHLPKRPAAATDSRREPETVDSDSPALPASARSRGQRRARPVLIWEEVGLEKTPSSEDEPTEEIKPKPKAHGPTKTLGKILKERARSKSADARKPRGLDKHNGKGSTGSLRGRLPQL